MVCGERLVSESVRLLYPAGARARGAGPTTRTPRGVYTVYRQGIVEELIGDYTMGCFLASRVPLGDDSGDFAWDFGIPIWNPKVERSHERRGLLASHIVRAWVSLAACACAGAAAAAAAAAWHLAAG